MEQNKHTKNTQEISEIRKKLITNKRIIIQLVVIILSFLLIGVAYWGLKKDSQEALRVNFISSAAGLMAGAFISIADYFFLKKDENDLINQKEDELSIKIEELVDIKEKLDELICGTKGIHLYRNRNSVNLGQRINEAKKNICIYVTNLDFLTNYFQNLIDATNRGVSIKILGLKPTNLFIATRFHELSKDNANSFFDEIRTHLVSLNEKLQKENLLNINEEKLFLEKIEVKLYVSQPTHMLFLFDDVLIVSFILRQGRARDRLHIEFDMSDSSVSVVANDFIEDFNLIWDEASELTKDLMKQMLAVRNYNLNSMEAQSINQTINRYKLLKNVSPKGKD